MRRGLALVASEDIVLVIDDNASVRAEAVRALRGAGYQALEAASLAQARRLLAAPIALVIIADKLPDGTAAELVASLAMPALVLASTPGSPGATAALAAGAKGSLNRQRPSDGMVAALRRARVDSEASLGATAARLPKRPSSPNLRPVAEPVAIAPSSATVPDAPDDAAARVLTGALEKELAFLRTAGHYRVLGVGPDASMEDLRAAFERFKAKWHPSRLSDDATAAMRALAGEIFAVGMQAFSVLGDPDERAAYKAPPSLVPKSKKRARGPKPLKPALPVAEPIDVFAAADLPPPPASDDPDLSEARQKLRKGDAAAAKGAIQKVLTRKPASRPAAALVHVANALESAADEERASREIEEALAEDPECVEALAVKEGLAQKRAFVLERISSDKISRRAVTEAVVLAFSNSALRDVVGTDALRTAISARYIEMVKTPGVLDLAPLWGILVAQPGFSVELALPPICRIKLWDRDIGGEVKLPAALGEISIIEAHKHAAGCKVADDAFARALTGANAPLAVPAPAPRTFGSAGLVVVTATETVAQQKKRGLATYLLVAAVVLCVGSAIYTFGGSAIRSLDVSEISTEIPAKEARKAGQCVALLLPDRSWLGVPEETRRKQLEDALEHARAQGAGGVVIMDQEEKILAQATENDGKVIVSFFAK